MMRRGPKHKISKEFMAFAQKQMSENMTDLQMQVITYLVKNFLKERRKDGKARS